MSKTLLEKEKIIVELDDSLPVLKHRWLKSPSSKEFRDQLVELQQMYIELKKEYPNLMWLANTQFLGELTADDEEWLEDTWEKMLFVDAGLKVHAVILADDMYADYSMEKFKMLADQKFSEMGTKLGVFMNEESAYEWMKKVTPT